MNPIAILSHAHFLQPEIWEEAMWGEPQNGRFGVLSKSIELAVKMDSWIYLCSGIPRIGGREFSPNSRDFIHNHFRELPSFRRVSNLENLNRRVIFFDDQAQTTVEEVSNAEPFFHREGITEVISVTAPKHSMRALQCLLQAKIKGGYGGIQIGAIPSDVDFPGVTANEVSILEKAHRHDTPKAAARLDTIGTAIVSLLRQNDPVKFERFMGELAELYGKFDMEVGWK